MVRCIDCKWFSPKDYDDLWDWYDECDNPICFETKEYSYASEHRAVYGKSHYTKAERVLNILDLNSKNDCKYFEAICIDKPWWKFW